MDQFPPDPGDGLRIDVVHSRALPRAVRHEVLNLCAAAYGEDLRRYLEAIGPGTHVLGRIGGQLVCHAMWVTRWLQPGTSPPLRTAYVELVGTHPDHRGHGYAGELMRRLVREIPGDCELAALAPADTTLYERLGWRYWAGPLFVRMGDGTLQPTPEERAMIFELPGRPRVDLSAPLSVEWREGEVW